MSNMESREVRQGSKNYKNCCEKYITGGFHEKANIAVGFRN
jgi:hypothetical protein